MKTQPLRDAEWRHLSSQFPWSNFLPLFQSYCPIYGNASREIFRVHQIGPRLFLAIIFKVPPPTIALRPDSGSWPTSTGLRVHIHWTHYIRYDSSGRVISTKPRTLPDKTQDSQETNIHVSGCIRTQSPTI